MLHILTTALVPSFRQLVSRSADAEAAAAAEQAAQDARRGVSPETDAHGTSKSSSSLFSIPTGTIPEKASDLPERPQDASAVMEAQVAARIAATGVRPDNPCDPSEAESAAGDMVEEARAASGAAQPEAEASSAQRGVSKLAALTMLDMKKARESMTGECDDDIGPQGSVCSGSPMSRTGSISTEALTDALRKLVIAGAQDGSEGIEEVLILPPYLLCACGLVLLLVLETTSLCSRTVLALTSAHLRRI